MKRIILSLLAVAAASIALAGCGGDGGGGEPLSKDEYAQKVASVGDALQTSFSDVASEAHSVSSGEVTS